MKQIRFTGCILMLLIGAGLLEATEIREWNTAAMDMIKQEGISNQFGNRTMAMLHIAMYDAVNGIQHQYDPFLVRFRAPKIWPEEAAVASAAYEVLRKLYPLKENDFKPLYLEQLARVPNHPRKKVAVVYGQLIANYVLKWRENDGSADAAGVSYPDGTEPGQWRRTDAKPPMLPGWGQVRPFTMISGNQFRLIGPLDMAGYEYARDYAEVMDVGRKTSPYRTAEQTNIARFWPTGIPRIWNLVAHQICDEMDYSLLEEARLFALLNVALTDSQIVSWDMKYYYGFWRPVTAIGYGDQDGNDNTVEDPTWESLLPSPPFPEYPSGHSTSCAAAATILAKCMGTDEFAFALNSEANPSLPPRVFNSFWEAAREAGISRIYGGIHFNFSNTEGLEAGRSLGRYIFENFMTK
ncbi:MAG: vanadium-dependent haloperoxidase [Sedimentisphaerales bacterium]|nr:vanadium-dependent haloperoxidase [Sedimentisphaerales bacterium]